MLSINLTALEQQNSDLSKVKVNEMLRFVRNVRPEVTAYDAVPSWVVLFIELLLMNAAMSFSILYFSNAWDAQSTASCCMSSDMSAFLITALRSAMFASFLVFKKGELNLKRQGFYGARSCYQTMRRVQTCAPETEKRQLSFVIKSRK